MISFSQIADIAADLEFVATLLSGDKVPLTSEIVTDIKDARRSVELASEILRALSIDVVEQLPAYLNR